MRSTAVHVRSTAGVSREAGSIYDTRIMYLFFLGDTGGLKVSNGMKKTFSWEDTATEFCSTPLTATGFDNAQASCPLVAEKFLLSVGPGRLSVVVQKCSLPREGGVVISSSVTGN